ncbi:MAG: hypothetical protein HY905_00320 [Deltaproteobacteria bacterium]|nr:hypothetical protein [Deltaproteobacteria bacterium]
MTTRRCKVLDVGGDGIASGSVLVHVEPVEGVGPARAMRSRRRTIEHGGGLWSGAVIIPVVPSPTTHATGVVTTEATIGQVAKGAVSEASCARPDVRNGGEGDAGRGARRGRRRHPPGKALEASGRGEEAMPALRLRGGERDAEQGARRGARTGDGCPAAAWR